VLTPAEGVSFALYGSARRFDISCHGAQFNIITIIGIWQCNYLKYIDICSAI